VKFPGDHLKKNDLHILTSVDCSFLRKPSVNKQHCTMYVPSPTKPWYYLRKRFSSKTSEAPAAIYYWTSERLLQKQRTTKASVSDF
jgi:hypothetical protein